jgi:Lsr2
MSGRPVQGLDRPLGGRTERQVAAEVVVLLMGAGIVQRTPEQLAKSADAIAIPVDAIRQAWDRRERLGRSVPFDGHPVSEHEKVERLPAAPSANVDPSVDVVGQLISEGLASTSKRVQKAASRAREAVDRLKTSLDSDRASAEARAEVDRLQRELAEAKARLRGDKPQRVSRPPRSSSDADGPTAREVRQWAISNKIPCPVKGRIPTDVMDRYHAEAAS